MDRRRQPRFETDQAVKVTVMGAEPRWMRGRILNISEGGVGLQLPEKVISSSAISIELEEGTLFGVVCHCKDTDEGFMAGIRLDRLLSEVVDLRSLMKGPAKHV